MLFTAKVVVWWSSKYAWLIVMCSVETYQQSKDVKMSSCHISILIFLKCNCAGNTKGSDLKWNEQNNFINILTVTCMPLLCQFLAFHKTFIYARTCTCTSCTRGLCTPYSYSQLVYFKHLCCPFIFLTLCCLSVLVTLYCFYIDAIASFEVNKYTYLAELHFMRTIWWVMNISIAKQVKYVENKITSFSFTLSTAWQCHASN